MFRQAPRKSLFYLGIFLGNLFVRFAFFSSQNQFLNKEVFEEVRAQNRSIIIALWHGQLLGSTYLMGGQDIYALVGYHRDAEMIARVLEKWGYHMIRGSSRDRGSEALKKALRVAYQPGKIIGITCDGPIGPFRQSKPGAAIIAHRTDTVIIPMGYNASRKKVLTNSWDNFYVPLPFGKNIAKFGKPIYPENYTGENSVSQITETLDKRLNHLQQEMDDYFSQP